MDVVQPWVATVATGQPGGVADHGVGVTESGAPPETIRRRGIEPTPDPVGWPGGALGWWWVLPFPKLDRVRLTITQAHQAEAKVPLTRETEEQAQPLRATHLMEEGLYRPIEDPSPTEAVTATAEGIHDLADPGALPSQLRPCRHRRILSDDLSPGKSQVHPTALRPLRKLPAPLVERSGDVEGAVESLVDRLLITLSKGTKADAFLTAAQRGKAHGRDILSSGEDVRAKTSW
jgi:hypothetical protein